MREWIDCGRICDIGLSNETSYVGEHSPVITLDGTQPRGMVQHELALKSGVPYNGRLVVRADRGVKVTVRLSWGDGQSVSQRVSAPRTWDTRHDGLNHTVDTTNARLQIIRDGE